MSWMYLRLNNELADGAEDVSLSPALESMMMERELVIRNFNDDGKRIDNYLETSQVFSI